MAESSTTGSQSARRSRRILGIEPELEAELTLSEEQAKEKVEDRQQRRKRRDTIVARPAQTQTPGPEPEDTGSDAGSEVTATTTLSDENDKQEETTTAQGLQVLLGSHTAVLDVYYQTHQKNLQHYKDNQDQRKKFEQTFNKVLALVERRKEYYENRFSYHIAEAKNDYH